MPAHVKTEHDAQGFNQVTYVGMESKQAHLVPQGGKSVCNIWVSYSDVCVAGIDVPFTGDVMGTIAKIVRHLGKKFVKSSNLDLGECLKYIKGLRYMFCFLLKVRG